MALLFFGTKSIYHPTEIVKKRVITVRVTFPYNIMHIRKEKKRNASRNYSPGGKIAVYMYSEWEELKSLVLDLKSISPLIRGSGRTANLRKERNVDGLGVNMIFGFRAWGFHEYEVISIYLCMVIASDKRRMTDCSKSRSGKECSY